MKSKPAQRSAAATRAALVLLLVAPLRAEDITINTFESANYGAWTTTGTAFACDQAGRNSRPGPRRHNQVSPN